MSERPLSVAMVIGLYPPVVGGTERSCHRLSASLVKAGYQVDVLTRRSKGTLSEEQVDGVRVHRFRAETGTRLGAAAFISQALAWLLTHPHDLVHCHQMLSPATIGCLAHRLTGRPVLVKLAGSGPIGDIAYISNGPLSSVRRRVLSKVSGYVCPSEELAAELTGWARGLTIFRVPNGIDTSAFRPPVNGERETLRESLGLTGHSLVFTGALRPEKNLLLLLQALAMMPGDVGLWIVGEGAERPRVEGQIADLGLAQRARLVGSVPDVRAYLAAADTFVLPSYSEGMSNSLLESMSVGCPIVASRIEGNQAVIQEGEEGLLFDPASPAELARAVEQLRADRARATRLGQAARRRAERDFDLAAVSRKYREIYQEILSEPQI